MRRNSDLVQWGLENSGEHGIAQRRQAKWRSTLKALGDPLRVAWCLKPNVHRSSAPFRFQKITTREQLADKSLKTQLPDHVARRLQSEPLESYRHLARKTIQDPDQGKMHNSAVITSTFIHLSVTIANTKKKSRLCSCTSFIYRS